MFETFSENLKKKIIASPEFNKAKGGSSPQANAPAAEYPDQSDDIPF
jgi:hypothetical protein